MKCIHTPREQRPRSPCAVHGEGGAVRRWFYVVFMQFDVGIGFGSGGHTIVARNGWLPGVPDYSQANALTAGRSECWFDGIGGITTAQVGMQLCHDYPPRQ